MDVLLLSPFQGRRPPPATERRLSSDEPWRGAVDALGGTLAEGAAALASSPRPEVTGTVCASGTGRMPAR